MERSSVLVIAFHEVIDFADQIFDIFECTSADGLLGNEVEPDLNLIEP